MGVRSGVRLKTDPNGDVNPDPATEVNTESVSAIGKKPEGGEMECTENTRAP